MQSTHVPKILVVDDDDGVRDILLQLLKREGFQNVAAPDGEKGRTAVEREKPDVALLDIRMPGMDGIELLRWIKGREPDLPVVMLTAYAEVRQAVEAMRLGAHDYLSKPFDNHEVVRVVRRALEERKLKWQLREMSLELRGDGYLEKLMGPSDAVRHLAAEVRRVAASGFNVVILGETGSGKELVARAIHRESPRKDGTFVPVDCGAIPETLFESELFGYEKGAFTGADRPRAGKFEAACGGTLLLDEIANMPSACQAKLLRVLQEKQVYRLGSTRSTPVDVRLLAAANEDLHRLAREGDFREDLFYRLNEFCIRIPPLRQRKDDVVYLAKRFLDITNQELKKDVRGFSQGAVEAMLDYSWPGNVRQLRSVTRRAVLMARDLVTRRHLGLRDEDGSLSEDGETETEDLGEPWKDMSLREMVDRKVGELECRVIVGVLGKTGGNKAEAARLLGVDYKTLHTKVKKYGIRPGERKSLHD